jgi:hypothetical protein
VLRRLPASSGTVGGGTARARAGGVDEVLPGDSGGKGGTGMEYELVVPDRAANGGGTHQGCRDAYEIVRVSGQIGSSEGSISFTSIVAPAAHVPHAGYCTQNS